MYCAMNGENQRVMYRLSRSAVEALPSRPGYDRFVATLLKHTARHCSRAGGAVNLEMAMPAEDPVTLASLDGS